MSFYQHLARIKSAASTRFTKKLHHNLSCGSFGSFSTTNLARPKTSLSNVNKINLFKSPKGIFDYYIYISSP